MATEKPTLSVKLERADVGPYRRVTITAHTNVDARGLRAVIEILEAQEQQLLRLEAEDADAEYGPEPDDPRLDPDDPEPDDDMPPGEQRFLHHTFWPGDE